jgi:putative transposase
VGENPVFSTTPQSKRSRSRRNGPASGSSPSDWKPTTDLPEKPGVDSLDTSNSVGIDLGILNYICTSDGKTVDWLDLEDDYERLRREQRKLSRKEKGSNNYENQRQKIAKVKRHIRRKVLDYQHKLSTWLVKEYDAVFVEDLNVAGMLQGDGNARNK